MSDQGAESKYDFRAGQRRRVVQKALKSSHRGEEAVVGEDGGQGEVSSVHSQTDGGHKGQVAQRQQVNCHQLLAFRQCQHWVCK